MKRIIIAILVIASLLLIAACGSKASGPEKTAQAFLDALENYDFTTAKSLATEESQGLLTMAEGFIGQMSDTDKEELDKKGYKIIKTEIEGETAVVTFEEWDVNDPETKKTNTLDLVKVDGDWKVKIEKENADK